MKASQFNRYIFCGKTGTPLTGTLMARLRKRPLRQDYAEAPTQSLRVRRAAKHGGVSQNTALLGDASSCPGSPIARLGMSPGSSKPMKPSSWRLSRSSGTCRARLASAKRRGLSAEQTPARVVRDR